MELDQEQENPFKAPENKKSDKKTLAIYVITAMISFSSLISLNSSRIVSDT